MTTTDWRTDSDLLGLINMYFRLCPDADKAEVTIKTWLALEIRAMKPHVRGRKPPMDTLDAVGLRQTAETSPHRSVASGSLTVAASQTRFGVNGPEWLKAGEAAIYLGQSQKTLANWRSARSGPPFAKRGGIIRYRKSDLDRWLEDGIR